jgi:hypothetical protein
MVLLIYTKKVNATVETESLLIITGHVPVQRLRFVRF